MAIYGNISGYLETESVLKSCIERIAWRTWFEGKKAVLTRASESEDSYGQRAEDEYGTSPRIVLSIALERTVRVVLWSS